MIVVDASCLYEVVAGRPLAEHIRGRLIADEAQAAPDVVDVEVFSMIRREFLAGKIDTTLAELAISDLTSWPGERFGHRGLLGRAWELRTTVRGWDAMYVALAEFLDATLVTLDGRLGRAQGPRCPIEVLG